MTNSWTMVRLQAESALHPDRDAQAKVEARARRSEWERLQAGVPASRRTLARLEQTTLPALRAAEAECEAALKAAEWAVLERAVAQMGNQVVADPVTGQPAVAFDAGEVEGDPFVLAARARLGQFRQALSRALEQQNALQVNLGLAEHTAPPPVVD